MGLLNTTTTKLPVAPLSNPVNEFELVMTSVFLDEDGEIKFTCSDVGGVVTLGFIANSSLIVIVVAMSVLWFDVLPQVSVSFLSFPAASWKQTTTKRTSLDINDVPLDKHIMFCFLLLIPFCYRSILQRTEQTSSCTYINTNF